MKNINKIVIDSKYLNGNSYIQVCYNKSKNELLHFWHAGFYVNFQKYFDDKNIITVINIFKRTSRKEIIEAVKEAMA